MDSHLCIYVRYVETLTKQFAIVHNMKIKIIFMFNCYLLCVFLSFLQFTSLLQFLYNRIHFRFFIYFASFFLFSYKDKQKWLSHCNYFGYFIFVFECIYVRKHLFRKYIHFHIALADKHQPHD